MWKMLNIKFLLVQPILNLIEERRKVLDVLLMADCIPAGMEAFVATDLEQFEVIKKVIDYCDYYVFTKHGGIFNIPPSLTSIF